MCFSAEASFAASGVLAASSVAIWRIPKVRASIPLSLFPPIFATHQFIEGILWLNHDGVLPDTFKSVAVYAYALIAFVLWPIFVPIAAYLVEAGRRRRIILLICQAIGLSVGLTLLFNIIRDPVQVSADCCSLSYGVNAPDLLIVPYLVAVSIPFLASSRRSLVLFGVGVTVSCAVAAASASAATFPSVWCFFAAILSAGLYLHFRAAADNENVEGIGSMLSKAAKQILVWGGVLILIGVLSLVNRRVELSPWVWAASLAGAGLGAFGLYLADRSDGPVLLVAYLLWALAGLIALVPSNVLRDGAIACYVLLAIALPFLAAFARNRARWWALIAAYPLLTIAGAIGLAESRLVSDDLVSAYIPLAMALPFFVIYARDRRQWWALIPGGILAVVGLSFGSWLPWHSLRSSLIAGGAVEYSAALALLVAGAWTGVRTFVARDPSDGPEPSGPEVGEPPAV